jgi:hypothetical protein
MIIDDKVKKYFFELKKYIETYKYKNVENIYEKMKEQLKLLEYDEVSFNNTSSKNIDIYIIKFHKFNKNFKETCIEYVVNVTLFDNDSINELSISVNYSEIKTTQKTLF